jgi:hypothetical protein
MRTHFISFTRLLALGSISVLIAASSACGSDDSESSGSGMGGGGGSTGGSGGTAGSGGSTGGTGGGTGGTGGSTGGMGGGTGGSGGTQQGGNAMLRIVHASPDAPAVDIYVKGSTTPAVESLGYGKSTDYVELPGGTYSFEIRAAGAAPSSPAAFEVTDLSLAPDKRYTAIAAGSLGSTSADDKFRVLPLEEGFDAASPGKARVRIVHASFDAPTVDLDVGNDDPGAPELAGLARFADSGSAGVELPAGTPLQVGIDAGGAVVTAFTTPPLPDAAELFVIATGELSKSPRDDAGFSLLAVLPNGSTTLWVRQNPFVYALHASPDAPAVDIYAGDSELFDNVPFGAMGRIQVPPGSYTLDFYPGQAGPTPKPSGAPAASVATPALKAGQTYLTLATGLLGSTGANAFQLFPLIEGFEAPAMGQSRVRVVHASPDAPAVDVGTVTTSGTLDANPPVVNAGFLDETGEEGLALPATSLTLGVAATGTTGTVAEFDVSLPDKSRLFAIAAGALSPAAGQPGFQLLVVDATSTNVSHPWTVSSLLPNK